MRISFKLLVIQALLTSFLHAGVPFNPALLSKEISAWHRTSGPRKSERYIDYNYGGQTVFRVLDRFTPTVDSLISHAKYVDGLLVLRNPEIIFF